MPKPRFTTSPSIELERGAAGDHLLQTPVGQFKLSDGPAQLAADGWVVFGLGRLPLIGNDDDPVDQGAGNSHLLRRERPGRGQTFHLGDDDPAVVPRRQCLIESAEIRAFMLRRDVAQLVGGGASNDGDVDRNGPVMEPLVTIELDNPHDLFLGHAVHAAALPPRIDERVESDFR